MQDTFLTDVAQFTHKTRDEPARIVAEDSIEFREGEHVTVRDGSSLSTAGVVSIAILGSMALAGKPVRCSGVVPGVTLLVSTGGLRSRDSDDADQLIVSGVFSTLRKKHGERSSPRTAYRRNAAWLMTVSRTLASP